MVRGAEFVFWICLLLVVYTYFFYPVVLFVAYALAQVLRDWKYLTGRHNRRAPAPTPEQLPTVTLIVPAYNEQASLPDKIANLREIVYPRERFEVVLVSDGSTDRTNELLRALEQPGIKVVFLPERRGKSHALNVAVQCAEHEILVFSDASTLFASDAVKNLVRHFSDPKVGVVCGALRFRHTEESRQTEGVYWNYEAVLRLMEARLGATLTASGAIYALRRAAWRSLAPGTILEDFVVPMRARKLGYRVLYDPEAVGTEFAAPGVAGEFTRRVRLAVGSFRSLKELIGPALHGFTGLAFLSHKLLRWLVPFLLLGLFLSNGFSLAAPLYRLAFFAQLLFYLWACAGFVFRHRMQRVRYALVGYFVLAMNLAFLVGFFRFLTGREEGAWQRVN